MFLQITIKIVLLILSLNFISILSKINKRVLYLSFIQGKGGLKDIHCSAQNAALLVSVL